MSCRSWFDPKGAAASGCKLSERLKARVKGERGVMLTLTYRRDGGTPRDYYRRASEEKHVAYFMRYLQTAIGVDLSGKWLRKMEFQRDGVIHFHVLLLGVNYLKHETLASCWRHGFAFVSRCTGAKVDYLCKYAAKGGGFPEFLLLERPRSVKFVSVSSGFWQQVPSPRRHTPSRRHPAFLPVYLSMVAATRRTIVVTGGRFRQLHARYHEVVTAISPRAISERRVGRWRIFQAAAASAAAAWVHSIHSADRDLVVTSEELCGLEVLREKVRCSE